MTLESEQALFKTKNRKKPKGNKTKVANKPTKDFSKLYNVNTQGKIKKKKVKKVKKPVERREGPPKEGYNVEQLEEKIQKLKEVEEPNKKVRKKLRQLEHLHKKITQQMLTEMSLGIDEKKVDHDDVSGEENDEDEGKKEGDISVERREEVAENSSSDEDAESGGKRFVLFVGNLPKETTEKDIQQHFAKVGSIKSVRIPENKENRKSGFAFIELQDRISYEKTLSMHHTMLNNKRINVLYTMPDGRTFDKKEIMRKNAKLDALRKAGKLAGSIPEHKKRSFRRKKKRLAEAKATAAMK